MNRGMLGARWGALAAAAVLAAAGVSCDDGGGTSTVPLRVAAVVLLGSGASTGLMAMVAVSEEGTPMVFVNDARVEINGVVLPRFEDGGYMITSGLTLHGGDALHLTVTRGVTVSADLEVPYAPEVTEPAAGSVVDSTAELLVRWGALASAPDSIGASIAGPYTADSYVWSDDVPGTATEVRIPAGILKPATTGIQVELQSVRRLTTLSGSVVTGSYFEVTNSVLGPAFSTL
jgi:hypothetical protein